MSRLVYEIYRVVSAVLGFLPLSVVEAVARGVGIVAWWFFWPYRRLVLENLKIAFGAEWTEEKRRWVGREHFARLASNMAAGIWWSRRDVRELLKNVDIEGIEHFHRLNGSGRGAVVVLSHLGNWELAARLIPALVSCPTGAIYQRLGNRWMDEDVRRQREREGLQLFERKQGFHAAIEMVRAGGLVGVLADQHAGDAGYWSPFFGRLASTSPLPATMALRAGAAVVSCVVYSRPNGRWRVVCGAEMALPGRDIRAWTTSINAQIEDQIREQPQDWLWSHNRWKTPKPDFLLGSVRRGVEASGFKNRFRLVVRSPNWLGDAVMSVPAVRSLKRGRPDLELTVCVPEKLADLWRQVPEVDRVLVLPAGVGIGGAARILREAGRFDAALLLPNSLRAALEAWFAGVPRRVGVRGHFRSVFLNQVVPALPSEGPGVARHQVHHYLHMARSVGAPLPGTDPDLMEDGGGIGVGDAAWPDGVGRTEGFHIAVCPGAEYGAAKRWFPERFAAVMREVTEGADCRWHLVGVARDRSVGERIEAAVSCGSEGGVVYENWMGRTSLRELVGLLRRCDALLTNDTGTMHLAAILGVPVVAVFGSTEPAWTGPLGNGHAVIRHRVACAPCFRRECPLDFECMNRVTVREVSAALRNLLTRTGKKKSSTSA